MAGGSGLARPTGMSAPERNVARKCQVRASAPYYWHFLQTAGTKLLFRM
jgi:hypothetical protein